MNDLLTCYINFSDPSAELLSNYLGKVPSTSLNLLKDEFFELLDKIVMEFDKYHWKLQFRIGLNHKITAGELKEPEMVQYFGQDITDIVNEKIDFVKKAAELRALTCGNELLVDYNYSVRMVVGSDQLRNTKDLIVVLELLLQSRSGASRQKILEFTQEEFTRFFQKLQAFESRI